MQSWDNWWAIFFNWRKVVFPALHRYLFAALKVFVSINYQLLLNINCRWNYYKASFEKLNFWANVKIGYIQFRPGPISLFRARRVPYLVLFYDTRFFIVQILLDAHLAALSTSFVGKFHYTNCSKFQRTLLNEIFYLCPPTISHMHQDFGQNGFTLKVELEDRMKCFAIV